MQAVNSIFKWSFYISSATGFMIIGGIVTSWLMVEILVILVGMTA